METIAVIRQAIPMSALSDIGRPISYWSEIFVSFKKLENYYYKLTNKKVPAVSVCQLLGFSNQPHPCQGFESNL